VRQVPKEVEFPGGVGLLQVTEIEFSEAAHQDTHGQEEAWTAGHPTAAVQGDSPTGRDTMQMGMMSEGLSPTVQDAEKAELRSQMLRIGGNGLQGFRSGAEQQAVHLAFVL
jgi:hypothetical protein